MGIEDGFARGGGREQRRLKICGDRIWEDEGSELIDRVELIE